MKCHSETVYQRFVDGDLGLLIKLRVVSHLKKCEICRRRVQMLRDENLGISHLFESDHEVPDLTQLIMSRINQSNTHVSRQPGIRFPDLSWGLRIAAVFLLIAMFLFFLFQSRDSGTFTGKGDVLIRTAKVEGQAVQTHVFESGDSNTTFIWLEKI